MAIFRIEVVQIATSASEIIEHQAKLIVRDVDLPSTLILVQAGGEWMTIQ
jgi:hypothetical protein